RNVGFQIALDDLGEGYSTLRLWSELRPEYVKIDKHFIHSINSDPVRLQFVKSIQQIADNSGTKVIAEGVETEAELVILRDLNIAFCQGYLLGRPVPEPIQHINENIQHHFCSCGVLPYGRPCRIFFPSLRSLGLSAQQLHFVSKDVIELV
ncbi:MAG: EAL domain-containing protein, partial [Pseudomonadota bacterium]